MMTFEEFKKNKLLVEFNGPLGQPDPTGISSPRLAPRFPMPANPTMGTQPGMSMQAQGNQYGQFVSWVRKLPPAEVAKVFSNLMRDMSSMAQQQQQQRPQ